MENDESSDEEFFDAAEVADSSSEEEIKDNTKKGKNVLSETKEKEDKPDQQETVNDLYEAKFDLPKPPPRRKKKPINILSTENDSTDNEIHQAECPTLKKDAICLTSSGEDLISIDGDLSVNILRIPISDQPIIDFVNEDLPKKKILNDISDSKIDFDKKVSENDDNSKQKLDSSINDESILDQVQLLNKDTGETIPLSKADEILNQCYNPLNPHITALTNGYPSDEDESQSLSTGGDQFNEANSKHKAFRSHVKKIGRDIINVVRHRNRENATNDAKLTTNPDLEQCPLFKLRSNRKKDRADFEGLRIIQEMNDCRGAIWCMKWSVCGQLLAVAGHDQILRVYCSHKAWKYFTHLRSKASRQQVSPSTTKDRSLNNSRSNSISSSENFHTFTSSHSGAGSSLKNLIEDNTLSEEGPMLLFSAYSGHSADVLDVSWSKNNFLLSSSMDKSVKLWHINRVECLCTFNHSDFVTTVQFHPRDDRYFLSGSLDGLLRLWNIPDKKVTLWNKVSSASVQNQKLSHKNNHDSNVHGLITASAFIENGKFAVIGTYDGRVIFYSTDQLQYYTQINVNGSKGNTNPDVSEKKKRRNSNKVTGIEGVAERKILVTTNDSRIRLYDLRDLSLACKYKGCLNDSSQIRASVSHDNKYIVCGSENSSFFLWRLQQDTATGQRRDRNYHWECVRLLNPSQLGFQTAPNMAKNQQSIVTAASFAPHPHLLDENAKYVISVADFNGSIKIFSR